VAVEADWPDAYRVNRYVRGKGEDGDANAALSGFGRFPNWMWRNTDVVDFVDWLRTHNAKAGARQAGFYGLDLYSLFTSIEEVLRYLERVDPEAAEAARAHYACFDHYHEDSQHYGYAANLSLSASCQDGVIEQLNQLHKRSGDYMQKDGAEDAFFYAQQNARLVKNAEEYYRTMFRGRISSWNLRDSHMAETLEALAAHLSTPGEPAKIVVWEHNSHIGDARATEIGEQGEWNVGELARKAYDGDTRLIGFSTYEGTVTAASAWDGPAEHKRVKPGMPGSYEALLHETGIPRFLLPLRDASPARDALRASSMPSSISIARRPSSPSTRAAAGTATSRRKPIPTPCERGHKPPQHLQNGNSVLVSSASNGGCRCCVPSSCRSPPWLCMRCPRRRTPRRSPNMRCRARKAHAASSCSNPMACRHARPS
jgi:erythromycin esterase-like protein